MDSRLEHFYCLQSLFGRERLQPPAAFMDCFGLQHLYHCCWALCRFSLLLRFSPKAVASGGDCPERRIAVGNCLFFVAALSGATLRRLCSLLSSRPHRFNPACPFCLGQGQRGALAAGRNAGCPASGYCRSRPSNCRYRPGSGFTAGAGDYDNRVGGFTHPGAAAGRVEYHHASDFRLA